MSPKMVSLVACALAAIVLPTTSIAQQRAAGPTRTAYKAPHNAFGQPDLTGTWTNTTLTRFERAKEFGDRSVLTSQEVAAIEGARAQLLKDGSKPTDPNATTQEVNKSCDLPGFPATADCAYNVGWTDAGEHVMRVNGQPRTSLITTPADGRIPYRPRRGETRSAMGEGVADNPEDRILPERCLVSQNISTGALLNPTLYNNTYVFAQNRDTVAIIVEMAHDARLVRLNAKHDPSPKWFGDSSGHWEGDTLVVETTNFHPQQLKGRNSAELKLTERFTRVANDRLLYQFRVEDPQTYTQPWGGEYEFLSSKQPQYEYACHEGNYGLVGILQGARAQEKERQAKLSER
ncbi:MAG: hypothetical protein ACXWKT_08510 [Caulobacteraceae bacterium]